MRRRALRPYPTRSPGTGETMAAARPARTLSRELLPALGGPTKVHRNLRFEAREKDQCGGLASRRASLGGRQALRHVIVT